MTWLHLSDRTQIARVVHRCYLCERAIEPGTRYVRRAGMDGRWFHAFAMHEACEALSRKWDPDEWSGHDAAEFCVWLDEVTA